MKKLVFLVFAFAVLSSNNALGLSSKTFDIVEYGARPGTLSTQAIQQAIDACHEAGGGKVLVPAGIFISGTLILKSRVNLFLDHGAEIRGSENTADYSRDHRRALIFCEDAIQVSITGKGVVNALGSLFYETDQNHIYDEFDRQLTRQKENYMPEGIFCTDGPIKRKPMPGMSIQFWHCNQVTISGITIKDTPVWAIRLAYCEDVSVDGITIRNNLMIPNSDGIHMTTSRNVRISDCDISCGDDAIIVTGFARDEETVYFDSAEQNRFQYGNKTIYAENIQVSNCRLQSRSSGIRVGYGQHPIRRCIFTNIVISDSNRGIGIFAHDVSDIKELIFSNIIIHTRLHNGQWWGNGEPIHLSSVSRFEGVTPGRISDVQFNNITATGEHGIIIYGHEDKPMENIRFSNVWLRVVNGKETLSYGGNFDLRPAANIEKQLFEHDIPGLYAQYVNDLSIRDLWLTWGDSLPSFFTHGIECRDVNNLSLEGIVVSPNPGSHNAQRLLLKHTTLR